VQITSTVRQLLRNAGIPTDVLMVEWPGNVNPLESSNFETLARKYRFQALGRACRDRGIKSLLLAHHEDDWHETLMMRLAGGHGKLGLMGMSSKAPIPECYGIHGVYQTVAVVRPLLDFSKERLRSTCVASGTPWFEDYTNSDPTLTPRNAVRKIIARARLPRALQKESLLSLSRRLQQRKQWLQAAAQAAVQHQEVFRFEPGSWTLAIRFPPTLSAQHVGTLSAEAPPTHPITSKDLGMAILELVFGCISPDEQISPSALNAIYGVMFPAHLTSGANFDPSKLSADEMVEEHIRPSKKSSTIAGVLCEWKANRYEWFLSRQPHPADISKQPIFEFPSAGEEANPQWVFYDGRYWIQVQNFTSQTLRVRALRERDLRAFRESFGEKVNDLNALLHKLAPGNVRFTLPAITMVNSDGSGRVLALPTLGIDSPGAEKVLAYKVRYKIVPEPFASAAEGSSLMRIEAAPNLEDHGLEK
jgi:tRNA(Ile)-lysidine synthase